MTAIRPAPCTTIATTDATARKPRAHGPTRSSGPGITPAHAGTRTPIREVGGLKFGEASMLDLNNLHREWYDWTMKSGPKPAFLKQRVAYYVVGPEEWKYAASLEAIAGGTRTRYLNSTESGANDALHSGTLN